MGAAVSSALAQTLGAIEVIVVADEGDRATTEALGQTEDERLRIAPQPPAEGPGGARNAGVALARADWVAFLDDDDLWDPRKLEIQLEEGRGSAAEYPIIASRLLARTPRGEAVWPRRLPRPGEDLSEYLLIQRALFWPDGLVHPSTWLTRRELLERVPFRGDLRRDEDWDWLLRAQAEAGAEVAFVRTTRPLATWRIDPDQPGASRSSGWRSRLEWARQVRGLLTPRAYASFLLTGISSDAAAERSWPALWQLPREAIRHGRPSPVDLLRHLGVWILPRGLRRRLAAWS